MTRDTQIVDLAEIAGIGGERRPAWSQQTEDLNINFIVLEAGGIMPEHINTEVDVLIVCVEGSGRIGIDGQRHELRSGQAIVIPKGTRRSIQVVGERFAYLSCHRRRAGLWPSERVQR